MTNTPSPITYRTGSKASVLNLFSGAGLFLLAIVSAIGLRACESGFGWNNEITMLLALLVVAFLASGIKCLVASIPQSMRFDPRAQTYSYRRGVGPLAVRKSGYYADLDCIVAKELTAHQEEDTRHNVPELWDTSYAVVVSWATEEREAVLVNCKYIEDARDHAHKIASETQLPYGGTYDAYNAMWLEGPFHKRMIASESTAKIAEQLEAASDSTGPAFSTPTAPPPTGTASQPDAPPALGDDAELNESDMWK